MDSMSSARLCTPLITSAAATASQASPKIALPWTCRLFSTSRFHVGRQRSPPPCRASLRISTSFTAAVDPGSAASRLLSVVGFLRHVESMSRLPSGTGRISHLNAVVLGEALAAEENDLIFPSPEFSRDALVSSPEQVPLSSPFSHSLEINRRGVKIINFIYLFIYFIDQIVF